MDSRIDVRFGFGLRVFLCLLLILFCFACKSVKTVSSSDFRTDSLSKTNITTRQEAKADIEQVKTQRDQSIIASFQEETVTDFVFSAPDSTGRQYVLRKTVTNRSQNARTAIDRTEQEATKSDTENKSQQVDLSQKKVDYKSTDDTTQTTNVSTPGFITWGVLALVASAIIILLLFLKSKKIL